MKKGVDKISPLCYNKDTKKGKEIRVMRRKDIKVMETEDWRNTPPQYSNLTDNRTVEWGTAKELTDIKERFAELTKLADDFNVQLTVFNRVQLKIVKLLLKCFLILKRKLNGEWN
jgi:hypothetical protein